MATAMAAALGTGASCTSSEAPDWLEEEPALRDDPMAGHPMYLTGAFDGSKAFRMWAATMDFARELEAETGKRLRFTYFINSSYYDHTVSGSWIGTSLSPEESLVRFAISQQAINEGHEIANHTVRHKDGGTWSLAQWRAENQEFHDLVEANLFEPVLGDDGQPVFPSWRPMPGAAPGEVGAACEGDADCHSGQCLAVSDTASFCTAGCNRHNPCANGTVCGGSNWNSSRDVCYPMPQFPVVHDGELLFDAEGRPNLASSQLSPYPIVGFRAPQLAHNQNLFENLEELGYRYDTSKVMRPGLPSRVSHGRVFSSMYEFALMRHPGSRTIPMDYNYYVNDGGTGARMEEDYKRSVRTAYASGRQPWNVGHHFSLWRGGAYWEAMKETFRYAAKGCPENGTLTCEHVEFPTFARLADILDGINAERDGELSDASDVFGGAGQADDELLHVGCGDHGEEPLPLKAGPDVELGSEDAGPVGEVLH